MQLNLERPDHAYYLRGADGSVAVVNDRAFEASFAVAPDRLIEAWPVVDATAMVPDDLAPLLALEPEVIVLGTGARQLFPPAVVMAACLGRGIGLEVMTNAAAARTFNVLAGESRRVVAAFVLQAPTG
jgi:uncharacterized protein